MILKFRVSQSKKRTLPYKTWGSGGFHFVSIAHSIFFSYLRSESRSFTKEMKRKRAVEVYILEKLHAYSQTCIHMKIKQFKLPFSFFPFLFICFNSFHYDCIFFQNSKGEGVSTYITPSESFNGSDDFLKARIAQYSICFSYRFQTI